MKKLILVAALAMSMAACGGKDEEKGGGGSGDVMKDAVGVLQEMAKVVEAAGDDCDKMADGLDKILDASGPKLTAAKKHGEAMQAKAKDDPKAAEKMMLEMKDTMGSFMEAGSKISSGMVKCMSNEKMKAIGEKYQKYQ